MKRWQRNLLFRRLGDLRDFHDWLGERIEAWDRTLERDRARRRPKPLCFPSELELMVSEMLETCTRRLVQQMESELLHGATSLGSGLVRIAPNATLGAQVKIVLPEDHVDG